jgi:hypothetical protein
MNGLQRKLAEALISAAADERESICKSAEFKAYAVRKSVMAEREIVADALEGFAIALRFMQAET